MLYIMRVKITVFLLCWLTTSAYSADKMVLNSGDKQTTLVELFTSEGCSSCPPAEMYINALSEDSDLWDDFVPVVFHVDYWDYLGWKDDYAKGAYAHRQRIYAAQGGVNSVYTPAVLQNGQAWNYWRMGFSPTDSDLMPGSLSVTVDDNQLNAVFSSSQYDSQKLILNVAVLGMNMQSHIRDGENEGRHAKHSFVVLGENSLKSNSKSWRLKLPEFDKNKASDFALAAWISTVDSLQPIQSVGGYFKP